MKRFGDYVLELGLVDTRQLQQALTQQENDSRPLGEILVDMGLISIGDIFHILKRQEQDRRDGSDKDCSGK